MERKEPALKTEKQTAARRAVAAASLASTLRDMPAGEWVTVQFDPETRTVEKIYRSQPAAERRI